MEDGLRLVHREYPTAIRRQLIVCRDAEDSVVAIEVKRRGEIDGVEQLSRYIERLHLDSSLGDVRGMFVAQVIKPQARVLAESRGYRCVEVDYSALRGLAPVSCACLTGVPSMAFAREYRSPNAANYRRRSALRLRHDRRNS